MPQSPPVENPPFDSFPRSPRPTLGVWLAHKPAGVTSFALVRDAQAALAATPGKAHAVCHAGALDPFATGLVAVLVGPITRVFERLHSLPKVYVATVQWGEETDTGDGDGRVVSRSEHRPSREALDAALTPFFGWQLQVPPATSNKRVGGERAYALAHRGESVSLPPSNVYLHSAVVVSHEPTATVLRITCGGGFYIRSLARDLARAVGSAAHVRYLHRVSIGPWGCPDQPVVSVGAEETLSWWPSTVLTDAEWGQLRAGHTLSAVKATPAQWALPSGWPALPYEVVAWHHDRLVALLHKGPAGFVPSLLFSHGAVTRGS
jgi:tRNA pseudouridine55 synthase